MPAVGMPFSTRAILIVNSGLLYEFLGPVDRVDKKERPVRRYRAMCGGAFLGDDRNVRVEFAKHWKQQIVDGEVGFRDRAVVLLDRNVMIARIYSHRDLAGLQRDRGQVVDFRMPLGQSQPQSFCSDICCFESELYFRPYDVHFLFGFALELRTRYPV